MCQHIFFNLSHIVKIGVLFRHPKQTSVFQENMPPKRKKNKKPKTKWPWRPEEEAVWGRDIIFLYGEIIHIDRVLHKALLTNQENPPDLSADSFGLAMRRKMGREPVCARTATSVKPSQEKSKQTPKTNNTEKERTPSSNDINDERLASLRESREKEPDLSHKQRLSHLQSANATLWGGVKDKQFRKFIQKDNKFVRENQLPPGTFRVPVRPYEGCPYPCQLCGKTLRDGVSMDTIILCRPNGKTEETILQWALDNELYDCAYEEDRKSLIACEFCTLPEPWGSGPPITASSLSTEYQNEDDSNDDDDDRFDERAMNYGFTEDEAYDLLCQGVQPWDEDAGAVLAALNGYY